MAGNVFQDKAALREAVEARRRALSPDEVAGRGGEVQRHLAALGVFRPGLVVALYDAQGFEVPLGALAGELAARGLTLAWPRVVKGQRELALHAGLPGPHWPVSRFGLREPPRDSPLVAPADVDVFLVPGVAFTRRGARLGRGGGYYDTTLALRKPGAVLIGVAFECQVVDELPVRAHDVSVDWLASEQGVHATRAPA